MWTCGLPTSTIPTCWQRCGLLAVLTSPLTVYTPPMFAGEGLELFDIVLRMDGLNGFDDEWAHALELTVGDVTAKVLPLARILVSKRTAARPKDRLVLPVLEEVLALQAARSDPAKS